MRFLLPFLFLGCALQHPKTHTPAPALDSTNTAIVDSKDAIRKAKTLRQRIEDKLIILQDWK